MRVLMLSIDPKVFEPGSSVRDRMCKYGTLTDELHIVVFTREGFRADQLSQNVWAYPTNSKWALAYFWQGFSISSKLLAKFKLVGSRVVVSSQEGFTNILALFLSLRYKFGLEVQVHVDIFSPLFRGESLKNRLRVVGYWLGVKRAKIVRVVSVRIKKSLIEFWAIPSRKVKVLPVFVDKGAFVNASQGTDLHKKFPQFEQIILMASRLSKEKNFKLALETFREIRKRLPRTGLLVVGDGPEKAQIVGDGVVLMPWTNDLASLYASADMFLLTSDYEGYGRTLIEAALVGTPIVTTDVGVVGELVNGHNALIAAPRDVDKLSKHIIFLLKNPEARSMMSSRLKKIAEDLLSEEQYLQAYKQLWTAAAK